MVHLLYTDGEQTLSTLRREEGCLVATPATPSSGPREVHPQCYTPPSPAHVPANWLLQHHF